MTEFDRLVAAALAEGSTGYDVDELGYYLEVHGFDLWGGDGWIIDDDHIVRRDPETVDGYYIEEI